MLSRRDSCLVGCMAKIFDWQYFKCYATDSMLMRKKISLVDFDVSAVSKLLSSPWRPKWGGGDGWVGRMRKTWLQTISGEGGILRLEEAQNVVGREKKRGRENQFCVHEFFFLCVCLGVSRVGEKK